MTGRAWIDALPAELAGQQAILRRLLAVCEADDRIRWLVIGCSLGRGNADALSDLDMALGVRDEEFDTTLPAIRAAAGGLGDLVDSYHHRLPEVAGPHERIFAQYADRCQLDLVVFPASTGIGRAPDIVVLHDPDHVIEVTAGLPAPTPDEVRAWSFRAWCVLADLGKYLRRHSLWEALLCLDEARANLWRLWALALGTPGARYGVTSILDFAPAAVPPEMASTVADLNEGNVLAAARSLASLLGRAGEQLPGEYRAAMPAAMAEFVTADLAALARPREGS